MKCSIAMQQTCTHGPKQLFPVRRSTIEEEENEEEEERQKEEEEEEEEGGESGGGDHNFNLIFHSNAAEFYSCAKANASFKYTRRKRRRRRRK